MLRTIVVLSNHEWGTNGCMRPPSESYNHCHPNPRRDNISVLDIVILAESQSHLLMTKYVSPTFSMIFSLRMPDWISPMQTCKHYYYVCIFKTELGESVITRKCSQVTSNLLLNQITRLWFWLNT